MPASEQAGRDRTSEPYEPLHVSLDLRHGPIFGAQLHFTAPYAVTSAREQYETELHVAACRNHSAIVGWHRRKLSTRLSPRGAEVGPAPGGAGARRSDDQRVS